MPNLPLPLFHYTQGTGVQTKPFYVDIKSLPGASGRFSFLKKETPGGNGFSSFVEDCTYLVQETGVTSCNRGRHSLCAEEGRAEREGNLNHEHTVELLNEPILKSLVSKLLMQYNVLII